MKSEDLAPLLAKAASNAQPQVGMRQGTLLAWDPATGSNTVQVAGVEVTDLPVLASGGIAMAVGDIVAVLRFGTTYFITGAIRNAGSGSLQSRAAEVIPSESRSSTTFGDLATSGPTVSDVYIGSSRQCIVIVSSIIVTTDEFGVMSFTVDGASSIGASESRSAFGGAQGTTSPVVYGATATNTVLLDASDGLTKGLNTFKAVYKSENGASVQFKSRRLVVIPF